MVTYLYKGSLITEDNKSLLENSLTDIPMKEGSRKERDHTFFLCLCHEENQYLLFKRKLSEAFPLNLSPNTIGKYLNQYINHYLIYK